MKGRKQEPEESMLTNQMDIGTLGFDDFQTILLKRSRERTDDQRRKINLLTLRYQMEDYIASDEKNVISAGEFLRIILKSLHIQQNKFAEYIGLKPSNLSKLMNGERNINYDMALIFGRLFNHNPMLWIDIQAKNELYRLINAERTKYSNYSLNDLISGHKNAI